MEVLSLNTDGNSPFLARTTAKAASWNVVEERQSAVADNPAEVVSPEPASIVTERRRIARDLHDSFPQEFQVIMLHLRVAMQDPSAAKAPQHLMNALSAAEVGLAKARRYVKELRGTKAPDAHPGDLLDDIEKAFDEFQRADEHLDLRAIVIGTPRPLATRVRGEASAIAREAVFNALKHSRAQEIVCELHYSKSNFKLVCRDDGDGMPAEILRGGGRHGHWGLVGMGERARQIEGVLTVASGTAGTVVSLTLEGKRAYANWAR